jgi:hypothetical protein
MVAVTVRRRFDEEAELEKGIGDALADLLDERDRMYVRLEAGSDPWAELAKASGPLRQLLEWDTPK